MTRDGIKGTDLLDLLYRKQTEHLIRHTITSPVINMAAAGLLAWVLWPAGPTFLLATWSALMLLVNITRVGLVLAEPGTGDLPALTPAGGKRL